MADKDSPNLDFLRSVAVLSVYGYHLSMVVGQRMPVDIGHFGVLLFFVHTSLVLMMSLERLAAKREPLFRSFYLRRLFRIYPLSVAVVCTVVLWELPRAPWWPWQPLDASAIAANLLLYMNLVYAPPATSVLWSLPYEVQMYLVLPVLFIVGRRFGARGIAALWVVSVVAGLTIPRISDRLEIFAYAPCFIAGVLAYFIGFGKARLPAVVWLAVLLLSVGIFWAGSTLGVTRWASWTMCLIVGAFAPLCAEMGLLRRSCQWIARYSYGIYLTHLYAMWFAFVLLAARPLPLKIGALVGLSVGLPVVLYHLIEAPCIRLGANLAGRLRSPPQPVASR